VAPSIFLHRSCRPQNASCGCPRFFSSRLRMHPKIPFIRITHLRFCSLHDRVQPRSICPNLQAAWFGVPEFELMWRPLLNQRDLSSLPPSSMDWADQPLLFDLTKILLSFESSLFRLRLAASSSRSEIKRQAVCKYWQFLHFCHQICSLESSDSGYKR
jgi:hypothetical protein